ncbi:hypothetical protein EMWEY_00002780 [Eimeria maxima]|uniref:Uncharacterized protein n=1 Tax=Eimeria maxima TaxID=5804 RepID=U6M3P7_EIMMA|nr:hypothetical protein EMWEY_00002780 [Eimeria maxima]CDJ58631.1 hypothetical protein EMWEY_00002780 [Eimeria maxima]
MPLQDIRIPMPRKQQKKKIRAVSELKQLEQELQGERIIRNQGLKEIDEAIEYKRAAIEKRHVRLVEWQQSVVNDAAAAALSASSGKWRRMLCVEKLIANSLQKTSVENVEKWQYKEDTFQKIREATGMADVMEIVNKFLNRDVENQKLKLLAEEAEKKLEGFCWDCQHFTKMGRVAVCHAEDVSGSRCTVTILEQNISRPCSPVRSQSPVVPGSGAIFRCYGAQDLWDFSAESSLEHYFQNLREKSIPKLIGFHDSIRNIRNCIGRDDNMEAHDRCALIIQPPANDTECHQEGKR